MRRAIIRLACLCALALLVMPYEAFAFLGVEAAVGYWRQSPSGTVQYGSPGSVLDVISDLNLGDNNEVFGRIKIDLPPGLPNIYVMATPTSFDGTGQTTLPVQYGNVVFAGGSPLQTKLKLDQYDLALYYPIPMLKAATLGVLNAEIGLDARQLKYDGTITGIVYLSPGITQTSAKSATYYIPMIYAAVQVKPVPVVSFEAEFRGITYGSNSYYDYIGRLKVMPYGPLFISGGYRYEQIKIDQDNLLTNLRIQGPFVEAGISF